MTTLRLVTAPTATVVTLDEAKAHLNVDFADDDALIQLYIDTAIGRLAFLNRALRPTDFQLDLSAFADEIKLPRAPLGSVASIKYLDVTGVLQTIDPSIYEVKQDVDGDGSIRLAFGKCWPATEASNEPISIFFTAGYPTLPSPLKAAILLIVGGLYEQRAEVTGASVYAMPLGVDALVSTFRSWTA